MKKPTELNSILKQKPSDTTVQPFAMYDLLNQPLLTLPMWEESKKGPQGVIEVVGNKNRPSKQVSLSVEDAMHNVAIIGPTGTYKTSGMMLPILQRLVELGIPGLLIDVKGDFTHFAIQYPDRFVRLGYGGQAVNLLQGLGPHHITGIIGALADKVKSQDPFWGSGGLADVRTICHLLNELDEPISLDILINFFNSPEALLPFLHEIRTLKFISSELIALLESRHADKFSVFNHPSIVGDFRNSADENRYLEQFTWQTSKIRNALTPFTSDARIKRAFCNTSDFDFNQAILRDKKIVLVDVPQQHYAETSHTINSIIRMLFFKTVLGGKTTEDPFTFMMCDEFQNYINVTQNSSMAGFPDDNTTFDKTRSARHINIIATQSVSSLLTQTGGGPGEYAVHALLANCRNKFLFPTDDPSTLKLINESVLKNTPLSFPLNPSKGLCLCAKTNELLRRTEIHMLDVLKSAQFTPGSGYVTSSEHHKVMPEKEEKENPFYNTDLDDESDFVGDDRGRRSFLHDQDHEDDQYDQYDQDDFDLDAIDDGLYDDDDTEAMVRIVQTEAAFQELEHRIARLVGVKEDVSDKEENEGLDSDVYSQGIYERLIVLIDQMKYLAEKVADTFQGNPS